MDIKDNRKIPRPYLRWSYALLALALFFAVLTGVVLDAVIAPWPDAIQRMLIALTLILPAGLGALMAVLSLRQRETSRPVALLSLALNGLFASFYTLLLGIAG